MFKITARWLLAVLAALMLGMTVASAQQYSRPPAFTQQELDQMLAPVALYPDSLLSQILMAATYPRDVDEAAQWSRRNSDLNGDRAVRAVERYDWDPSVKSLVAFPQILDMMYEKMDWTQDLGDAFLDQQAQVMDTVQYLRRQAYSAGNLRSSDQIRVEVRDGSFVLDFVSPEYVYVPYYDPLVIYGRWWWPTRPVYWAPWHGYYARPGYVGYVWGAPIPVSRGFFYSAPDWRSRRINIVNVNNYYYRAPAHVHSAPNVPNAPHVWQHDNEHRGNYARRDGGWRERDGRAQAAPVQSPHPQQARVAPQPQPQSQPQAAQAPAPQRVEANRSPEAGRGDPRFENRGDRRERFEGRNEPGNRAQQAQAPQTAAPQAAPAPQPQPAASPASNGAANNGEARRFGERGFENRGNENRNERRDRNEGRFEGMNHPQAAAAPLAPRPAPVAAPAPQVAHSAPVAAPAPAPMPPIVNQARPPQQQMPVATPPPPAMAHHGNPQASVAAAPRGPEKSARPEPKREQGNHGGRER